MVSQTETYSYFSKSNNKVVVFISTNNALYIYIYILCIISTNNAQYIDIVHYWLK